MTNIHEELLDTSYKVTLWDKYVKMYPTYIEMIEVKITKRKHPVYLNWSGKKDNTGRPSLVPIIGKWQYVAESVKGKIGIVELPATRISFLHRRGLVRTA